MTHECQARTVPNGYLCRAPAIQFIFRKGEKVAGSALCMDHAQSAGDLYASDDLIVEICDIRTPSGLDHAMTDDTKEPRRPELENVIRNIEIEPLDSGYKVIVRNDDGDNTYHAFHHIGALLGFITSKFNSPQEQVRKALEEAYDAGKMVPYVSD